MKINISVEDFISLGVPIENIEYISFTYKESKYGLPVIIAKNDFGYCYEHVTIEYLLKCKSEALYFAGNPKNYIGYSDKDNNEFRISHYQFNRALFYQTCIDFLCL